MDLKSVVKSIETRFGKEAISGNKIDIEFISSGILSVDLALGGGWARGRIAELMGWESSGKSTLALMLAAEAQKLGLAVGYIDMEHAVDLHYARALGVDVDNEGGLRWVMSQPDNAEQALEIVREFLRADEIGVVVIDSVAALVPRAKIQGEAGDQKMGLEARLMSDMLKVISPVAKKSNAVVLFINQFREKIGVMFGSPTTTTGGNALKFYASQRVEITKIGQNKDGEEVLSNRTRVKVVKNKVAPPFLKTEFDIVFGEGVDSIKDIIELAVGYEVIKKAGSWFSYGDVKLGQGAENVKVLLKDNPELLEEIKSKLLEIIM